MPGEAISLTDTTYAGEVASYMITRPVVDGDTINKGCIMVEDGIKKQKTIPRLEVTNIFQKRTPTPVSQGTVTVDAVTLVPNDMMLYFEFNPRDFEAHWYATEMNPKLLDAQLPATIESFMMMQVLKRSKEFMESAIWKSRVAYDPANGGLDPTSKGAAAADSTYMYFDGLIKKALANASTIQVGSPVALTPSNIRTKFQAAYNLVPQALLGRYGVDGLKFFISYADQQNYENAMQTDTFKNQDTTEKGVNKYNAYEVVPLAGLPANTFFVGIGKPDTDSNLWLGLNSVDDNNLQLQKLQANSEFYFVKGLLKADVQIGFADQLVMYSTITN